MKQRGINGGIQAARAVIRHLIDETDGPLEFALACDLLREFYMLTLDAQIRSDTEASRADLLPIASRALREAFEQWKDQKARPL